MSSVINSRIVRGVLSGFDHISTGDPIVDDIGTLLDKQTLSLDEILTIIKDIETNFNKDKLYELEALIQEHINNTGNPHKITASQLGITVVDNLYAAWLADGNVGTLDKFKEILFQDIAIGTVDDIDNLTIEKFVTMQVLAAWIINHNTDPDAHAALLEYHLPGDPKIDLPFYSFNAAMGIASRPFEIIGNSTGIISRMNVTGQLEEVDISRLVPDYSESEAVLQIVGYDTINYMAPSYPLASGYSLTNMTSVAASSIYRSVETGNATTLFDTAVDGEHSFMSTSTTGVGGYFVVSLYISPKRFPILIHDNRTDPTTSGVLINSLDDITAFGDILNLEVQTYSYPYTGYIRIGYCLNLEVTSSLRIVVRGVPEGYVAGGALTYLGTGAEICTIDALSIENGTTMTPHIRNTTTSPTTREAFALAGLTSFTVFNRGTLHVNALPSYKPAGTLAKLGPYVWIAHDASLDKNTNVAWYGHEYATEIPVTDPELLNVAVHSGIDNFAVSWSPSEQRYYGEGDVSGSYTPDEGMQYSCNELNCYLSLGASYDGLVLSYRNHLKLKSFQYYQSTSTENELKFLVGAM